jgi:hypothetical protein
MELIINDKETIQFTDMDGGCDLFFKGDFNVKDSQWITGFYLGEEKNADNINDSIKDLLSLKKVIELSPNINWDIENDGGYLIYHIYIPLDTMEKLLLKYCKDLSILWPSK